MNKKITNVITRKNAGPIPIWFMRQAGRYLPEYRELRKGKTFEDMVQNPDIACEVTLQPIHRFDLDAAIIFSDILIPLYYMNLGLKIVPEKGPILDKPVTKGSDVADLPSINPKDHFPYVVESIKKVKSELSSNKTLIGFSGAPFTLASYLIEGKSTRDALKTKSFALKYPDEYKNLLNYLSEIVINQLKTQVEAGAEIVQIFDSWAIFLSPSQYRKLALPFTKKIISSSKLKSVSKIHFAQGSGHLLESFTKSGTDVLSIDTSSDLKSVIEFLDPLFGIQGNLDPAVLFTEEKIIKNEINKILSVIKNKPNYIFNLGRGIHKDTPLENVNCMVDHIKKFNQKYED